MPLPSTLRRILSRPLKAGSVSIPSRLQLEGSLDFQAASDAESDSGPATFLLLANTGKPMRLSGFLHPVVIDVAGSVFDRTKTPVIADHDTSKRIGHTTQQSVIPAGGQSEVSGKSFKGPAVVAHGVVSSGMGIAQGFVQDAKAGFPFQVSVGASIEKAFFVEEGQNTEVNGKSFKGPLIVASKTRIRELTVAVLGADASTSAQIAASIHSTTESPMEPQLREFIIQAGFADPDALTDEQVAHFKGQLEAAAQQAAAPAPGGVTAIAQPAASIAAATPGQDDDADERRTLLAAEEARIDGLRAAAEEYGPLLAGKKLDIDGEELDITAAKQHAIAKGWSKDQLELEAMRATRSNPPNVPAIHSVDCDIHGEAMTASILRYYGVPGRTTNIKTGREYGLEAMFTEKVLEASHSRQHRFAGTISELLDIQVRAAGRYPTSRHMDDLWASAVTAWDEVRASGFSTLSVTNVLENVMHKSALVAFEGVEGIWRFICGRLEIGM